MTKFKIGDRVNRKENNGVTGATVISIQEGESIYYEIAYDEGGSGWWPEYTLELIV